MGGEGERFTACGVESAGRDVGDEDKTSQGTLLTILKQPDLHRRVPFGDSGQDRECEGQASWQAQESGWVCVRNLASRSQPWPGAMKLGVQGRMHSWNTHLSQERGELLE